MALIILELLVIFFICLIPIIFYNKSGHSQENPYSIFLEHINGHPKIKACKNVILSIDNNDLVFNNRFSNKEEIDRISIDNLISYDIKDESQIQKDVTLTRLFALGLFALVVPKKTTVVKKYLILFYKIENIEVHCLFKWVMNWGTSPINNFTGIINNIKIQNSITKKDYKEENIL